MQGPSTLNVIRLIAGLAAATLLGSSALAEAPLVYCTGSACNGSGSRAYTYQVDSPGPPIMEFRVGTNDLNDTHYLDRLDPQGWNFAVEDVPMAHAHGVQTPHGAVSPGPSGSSSEGSVRWWTDDPALAVESFTFGYNHYWDPEDVGWQVTTRADGLRTQANTFEENWDLPVGDGYGPVHGPHEKRCGTIAGIACDYPDEFCKFPEGTCSMSDRAGVCAPIPGECPDTWEPVCGCDGVTYDNECYADMAEASIDHQGECLIPCSSDADCDDGLFCNGAEVCIGGSCQSGDDPCPGRLCDEDIDACVHCVTHAECDDGLFCNGVEMCIAGYCQSGGDPCPEQQCDEATDACVDCLTDADCGDGVFCNGIEECENGACADGAEPCPGRLCNEVINRCVDCLVNADCDDGDPCTNEVCTLGECVYSDRVDCTDADGDGTPDHVDGCPNDSDKVTPGECGCGVPDSDADEDGVAQCVDNCPDVANEDQEDSDADGVGDACDEAPADRPVDDETPADGAVLDEGSADSGDDGGADAAVTSRGGRAPRSSAFCGILGVGSLGLMSAALTGMRLVRRLKNRRHVGWRR